MAICKRCGEPMLTEQPHRHRTGPDLPTATKEQIKASLKPVERRSLITMPKEDVQALLDRIDALEGLLVCYRIGKAPTEALHQKLDRTRAEWHRIREQRSAHIDGDE